MAHDSEAIDLAILFDGEVGDVTEAEVQLIESSLGDLLQAILQQDEER